MRRERLQDSDSQISIRSGLVQADQIFSSEDYSGINQSDILSWVDDTHTKTVIKSCGGDVRSTCSGRSNN